MQYTPTWARYFFKISSFLNDLLNMIPYHIPQRYYIVDPARTIEVYKKGEDSKEIFKKCVYHIENFFNWLKKVFRFIYGTNKKFLLFSLFGRRKQEFYYFSIFSHLVNFISILSTIVQKNVYNFSILRLLMWISMYINSS